MSFFQQKIVAYCFALSITGLILVGYVISITKSFQVYQFDSWIRSGQLLLLFIFINLLVWFSWRWWRDNSNNRGRSIFAVRKPFSKPRLWSWALACKLIWNVCLSIAWAWAQSRSSGEKSHCICLIATCVGSLEKSVYWTVHRAVKCLGYTTDIDLIANTNAQAQTVEWGALWDRYGSSLDTS